MAEGASIHATAVLAGRLGVLIRGPSGSGKTALARTIIAEPGRFGVPFGRLVADDRVLLAVIHGRLLASAPSSIAGKLEIRGMDIVALPFEAAAVVHLVVDLDVANAERIPADSERFTWLHGIKLPRLALAHGAEPVIALRDFLRHRL